MPSWGASFDDDKFPISFAGQYFDPDTFSAPEVYVDKNNKRRYFVNHGDVSLRGCTTQSVDLRTYAVWRDMCYAHAALSPMSSHKFLATPLAAAKPVLNVLITGKNQMADNFLSFYKLYGIERAVIYMIAEMTAAIEVERETHRKNVAKGLAGCEMHHAWNNKRARPAGGDPDAGGYTKAHEGTHSMPKTLDSAPRATVVDHCVATADNVCGDVQVNFLLMGDLCEPQHAPFTILFQKLAEFFGDKANYFFFKDEMVAPKTVHVTNHATEPAVTKTKLVVTDQGHSEAFCKPPPHANIPSWFTVLPAAAQKTTYVVEIARGGGDAREKMASKMAIDCADLVVNLFHADPQYHFRPAPKDAPEDYVPVKTTGFKELSEMVLGPDGSHAQYPLAEMVGVRDRRYVTGLHNWATQLTAGVTFAVHKSFEATTGFFKRFSHPLSYTTTYRHTPQYATRPAVLLQDNDDMSPKGLEQYLANATGVVKVPTVYIGDDPA